MATLSSYRRPEVFIGSSTQSLAVVDRLALALQKDANITRWNESGFFEAGDIVLDRLLEALPRFDFAILVFGFDDVLETGGIAVPRDNVLFELGMFMARLGRHRVYVVTPYASDKKIKILSDLGGLVYLSFHATSDPRQLDANLSEVVNQIKAKIRKVNEEYAAKVAQPTTPGDVHDLTKELETVIAQKLAQKPAESILIRNLALDMEVTWGYVRDRYLQRPDIRGIGWHSLMIDVCSPEIQRMQSTTVSIATAGSQEKQIKATLPRLAETLRRRFVDFEVRAYKSPPAMHGFLVDDEILFLSFCKVEQATGSSGESIAELVGSPNAYWRFDRSSGNPSDEHFIQAFASWFDYLWAGSRKIWPN